MDKERLGSEPDFDEVVGQLPVTHERGEVIQELARGGAGRD
jgi:hypothetical protein